jgi:DMSO/TMAO reductase YedYZ heme-binding membrane subunit
VAWALLAATVFWGLLFSGRLTRTKPKPAWNLDLHRFLGGLAVIFVAIHVAALMADRYVNFGVAQVFVPFASHWRPGAVAWGITAMYLVVAVEATSLAMRWLPRKLWRQIHMLSFVLFATSTVHAIQTGTDTATPLVRGIGIAILAAAVVALVLRVAGAQRTAAARAGRAIVPSPISVEPAPVTPLFAHLPPSFPTIDMAVTPPLARQLVRPSPPLRVPVPNRVLLPGRTPPPRRTPLPDRMTARDPAPVPMQWPPVRHSPKVARFAEPPGAPRPPAKPRFGGDEPASNRDLMPLAGRGVRR